MDVDDYLHQQGTPKGRSKYGNKRVKVDGRTFASKKEAKVYNDLKILQGGGHIEGFKCQVTYPFRFNDVKICSYRADFVVKWNNGRVDVWDAKGFRTPEYKIKKNLMKAFYGIDIVEV
jgi:hypothetical protein